MVGGKRASGHRGLGRGGLWKLRRIIETRRIVDRDGCEKTTCRRTLFKFSNNSAYSSSTSLSSSLSDSGPAAG